MRRRRNTSDEGGPQVPSYIVTFSDMVTLLLTFFVMLLGMASVQDAELFHRGRDSFLESINKFGIGMLFGKDMRPEFSDEQVLYSVDEPELPHSPRNLDADIQTARSLFQSLTKVMTAMPSRLVAETTTFSATDIRFAPGQADLNASATDYLARFSQNLATDPSASKATLCVLGLAGDCTTDRQRWFVSARRAQAVGDYLRKVSPSDLGWPIFSWGAGAGGEWVGKYSPVSADSQILIAVLRPQN